MITDCPATPSAHGMRLGGSMPANVTMRLGGCGPTYPICFDKVIYQVIF